MEVKPVLFAQNLNLDSDGTPITNIYSVRIVVLYLISETQIITSAVMKQSKGLNDDLESDT